LLIPNPLRGASECGDDFVDPLRQQLRIGREGRLLSNELDLFFDARQLRVEERLLAAGLGLLRQTLTENIRLARQAPAQIVTDVRRGQGRLEVLEPPFEAGATLASIGIFDHPDHRLARDEQPQVHPQQTTQPLVVFPHTVWHGATLRELIQHGLGPRRQRVIAATLPIPEARDQAVDLRAPFAIGPVRVHRVDDPLEALVRGEDREVAKLEPRAEHPETGVRDAEQRERAETDPVRRHEHADRPRIERCAHVIEEAVRLGHRVGGNCTGSGLRAPGFRGPGLQAPGFRLRAHGSTST
jgi:hypothetical protein